MSHSPYDDRHRYGGRDPRGYGPAGEAEFHHDYGLGPRPLPDTAPGAYQPGPYEARPYAHRSHDYNYDPRGGREYAYGGARGSALNPAWDHYRGDIGVGEDRGDFGYVDPQRPPSGREAGASYFGPNYAGEPGPRYGGADYGRGPQRIGPERFDSDDAYTRERMRQWSGARSSGMHEVYGPYGGSWRSDEGRSGLRSSWGASDAQLARTSHYRGRGEGGRREWRDTRGRDFRGYGPEGYTPSDDRLTERICERMTEDPDIDPADVRVQVSDGVVTLSGRVDERWTKHHIEDLVDACAGVKDIENRIRVGDRDAAVAPETVAPETPARSGRAGRTAAPKSRH